MRKISAGAYLEYLERGRVVRTPSLQECIAAWNAQADIYNQWPTLDADERCEWCLQMRPPEALNSTQVID